jgi:hypothetical protein
MLARLVTEYDSLVLVAFSMFLACFTKLLTLPVIGNRNYTERVWSNVRFQPTHAPKSSATGLWACRVTIMIQPTPQKYYDLSLAKKFLNERAAGKDSILCLS